MPRLSGTATMAAVALLCALGVGIALALQHYHDMLPCPWCVLQRFIYVVIGALSLLAWAAAGLLHMARLRRAATVLLLLLCGCGAAAALWQHFVAASAASCDLTLAERILNATGLDERFPEVFTAWASCKDAAVNLFGVPFEIWSLALYGLLGALLLQSLRPDADAPSAAPAR